MRFYKETNFKDTEIGRIPKEWEVVRLGQVLTYIKGKKPEKMVEEYREDYLPYLSTDYLRENKTTRFAKPSNDTIVVDDGDLILLWDGSNAGEFFFGKRGIVSSTMAKIELKEKNIDKSFFFYLLKTKESFLKGQTRGTGIPHVDECVLTNILVSLPPLSEQDKIAEIFSTIDKAIQKTNEIIAKTERLKKGLMEELLTKGIGHKEFKDTEIGRIPKEWEVMKIKDIAEMFISGGTPSTRKPNYWNGNIPWIRSVHLSKYYVDEKQIERYISKEGLENSASNIVPRSNLIIATRVGIGKAAVNLFDVAINQDLTGIVIDKSRVDPFFVVWYFLSPRISKKLGSFVRGTTIKGIAQNYIKNLSIPIPPLPEQQKIAEILSTIDKKLEIERKEKEKLERIKQGMMDLLLTGKIRVKVA